MGQVPFGIIGNGRVARHMRYYLESLGIPWRDGVGSPTLVLVSDRAIDEVAKGLPADAGAIHFSGSVVSQYAYGAHPLYTFTEELYPVEVYREIPFVVEEEAPDPPLPGLPNRLVRISREDKARYHALCVLAGNFTCMLWERLYGGFEQELGIPREVAYPYLQQVTANLQSGSPALTGPLSRGDWETVRRNLLALEGDSYQQVYEAFVSTRKNP